ncbi:uncharacterized protein LOC129588660 [Paramacrobiotus metropolitanus]|uniref:uncharacterized protein LOC129588660 n=1 Tax=Paramacrobiotus metropolitanus TaxID=2943436 RepID=UPI002446476C|nr:uncharacterized protein LOC129588660 [Paramacrobiotus metropolitanus]
MGTLIAFFNISSYILLFRKLCTIFWLIVLTRHGMADNSCRHLDRIIERLLKCRNDDFVVRAHLDPNEINSLCNVATRVFRSQPVLLRISSPLCIAGDIHGQYNDLLRLFEQNGRPEDGQRYLFLGDYVDRGAQSIETICLLLAYKIKFPHDFYLIRGNHEERALNKYYGFRDECVAYYGAKMWSTFNRVFDWMPLAAVVCRKIFCAHGGIGPTLDDLAQIDNISRPHRSSSRGVACDLLWADPDPMAYSWKKNVQRNVSYVYGRNQVHEFLQGNNLQSIVRAHEQPADRGFSYPFFPDTSVLTIFSAPGYEGSTTDGAVVRLDKDCVPTIRTLRYLNKHPEIVDRDTTYRRKRKRD